MGEDALTFPSRLPDPEDQPRSYADLEDDAWSEVGFWGLVGAFAIIVIVAVAGTWLDAHPAVLSFLAGKHR